MPIPAMLGFIQAVQAAPLETYGRLPTLENVALSPDGSRLAFVRTDESTRVLVLADLTEPKKANRKVEMVTMKKEDHWLSRGETRLQMLPSSIVFLKANNPPD
jgi:dipeptidyl aminopeptidase/acylaminoacyl peptidase